VFVSISGEEGVGTRRNRAGRRRLHAERPGGRSLQPRVDAVGEPYADPIAKSFAKSFAEPIALAFRAG
jgi:hypothetical protein